MSTTAPESSLTRGPVPQELEAIKGELSIEISLGHTASKEAIWVPAQVRAEIPATKPGHYSQPRAARLVIRGSGIGELRVQSIHRGVTIGSEAGEEIRLPIKPEGASVFPTINPDTNEPDLLTFGFPESD